jgi:uncharacterized membrane protein (DUF4010 family)
VDPTPVLFGKLGISLLLGLLVGLQRQRTATDMPGLRTFPLITVFGTVCGLLAVEFGGWIVAAGLVGLVAVLVFPNLVRLKNKHPDPGITTDVAVLLMYGVGAFLVAGPMAVAIAVGGGVAVLLEFKLELHRFAETLRDGDLKAIMQFVLITCIVLPVLPNNTYGPLDVLNPFEIWLMVALIVGMSLGGYIVYKFLGRDAGILLGGVLGGAISSTATTVSYSRRTSDDPTGARTAAIVIMIASTVVFGRVLIEIAVVAPGFLVTAAPPVLVLAILTLVPSLVLWFRVHREPSPMPEQGNPTQLKSAVMFGGMYALVLWALAAAKTYAGGEAMYVVALLSGLTDMDAITLSTARMFRTASPVDVEGWRLIIVAALANLAFKAGVVGLIGHRRLFKQIAMLFALPLVGGIVLIFFWPKY